MLLFEFFPAFMMLVSLIVGIWLWVVDRQASRDDAARKERGPRAVSGKPA